MNIDEIIIKLCNLNSQDEMELVLQKEMERIDTVNSDNFDPIKWQSYYQSVYDLYGYLIAGKFRNFKPIYQKLMDKLKHCIKKGVTLSSKISV